MLPARSRSAMVLAREENEKATPVKLVAPEWVA